MSTWCFCGFVRHRIYKVISMFHNVSCINLNYILIWISVSMVLLVILFLTLPIRWWSPCYQGILGSVIRRLRPQHPVPLRNLTLVLSFRVLHLLYLNDDLMSRSYAEHLFIYYLHIPMLVHTCIYAAKTRLYEYL